MHQGFKPFHIHATREDLAGNNGIGRYIFLPGSDGRAKEIAENFSDLTVNAHSRGHNLYLGRINDNGTPIDVAAISTGMGCPSMEIILHELYHLGGKRFLRVGTAGSLQPYVKLGDFINVRASVRDESSSRDYVPVEFPAIAANEMLAAIQDAAKSLSDYNHLYTGLVHCKSTFYAREFSAGPLQEKNDRYMKLLTDYGVLATEMETASLFTQAQLYDNHERNLGTGPSARVLAGALLGIVAIPAPPLQLASDDQVAKITHNLIELAFASVKSLASSDRNP